MSNERKNTIIDLYTKKLKVEKPALINIETNKETEGIMKMPRENFNQILNGQMGKNDQIHKNKPIKLSIKSDGMVELKPSNKTVTSFLVTFSSSLTRYENECWYFDLSLYNEVKTFLKNNKMNFEEIPKGVLEIVNKKFPENNFEFVHPIYKKLLPFQREGVKFALNRNGRIILADDMGLGKTIQALAIACYYKIEFPLLIISPASLLENWVESVKVFLEEDASILREKGDIGDLISVISYEKAAQLSEYLKHKVIIADECHYFKSTQSKRTTKLLPVLQNANRAILLSGTPALSRPLELYPLICAINKAIFPKFTNYGMRYCAGKKIKHWYDYKGCSNSEELYFLLLKFMLRRTKDEVLSELPPKNRKHIILMPVIKKKIEIEKSDFEKAVGNKISATIMQRYNESAEIKIEVVIKYLKEILEKNVKFLVFAHHLIMLNAIEDFLKAENINFIRIDGNTPTHLRHNMCSSFQNDSAVQAALLSLTAASTGLTLTEGKMVIFAELYWNPGTMLQAEDRVHRIGQNTSVNIHYLVARNTIDEIVWPHLLKKLNVLESLGIQTNQLKGVKKEGDFFKAKE